MEWVYSQPSINWTTSEANLNLRPPGSQQTTGENWEYYDLYSESSVEDRHRKNLVSIMER